MAETNKSYPEKTSFIIHTDSLDVLDDMDDATAGQLFKAIKAYQTNQELELDMIIKIALSPFKNQFKRDDEKWGDKIEVRSKNGRLGNLKRWHFDLFNQVDSGKITIDEAEMIANDRKVSLSDNSIAKVAVSVSVSDSVSDSDSDSDSEKENVYSANIQDRDREFYNSLTPYKEKYGKDILRPFYEYWSERGDKDVKMKFEKQKSFSVPARLSTWARNDKKWDKTKETKIGRQTHATIESNQQGW